LGGELVAEPVEMAGDSVFQKAVRDVVAAIPVAELVDDPVDALIFHPEADAGRLVESYLPPPDPLYRNLWLVAIALDCSGCLRRFC